MNWLKRRPLRRALWNWIERHQHPFNLWIHMVGIPLAFAGIALFFLLPQSEWLWAVLAVVGGYLLQYIGHRVEGNDMGEWAGLKRLLGLPYVAIAPKRGMNDAKAISTAAGRLESEKKTGTLAAGDG